MEFLRKALCSTLAASLAWMPIHQAAAEDIDLFVGGGGGAATNPNLIFMIDNSANWSSAAQNWPDGRKQGQSELRALRTVIGEASDKVNVGLMMFTNGQGSDPFGAYVRYHVRQMTTANKLAFQEMIGADTGCKSGNTEADVPNNSLTGVKNCILEKYDDNEEKTGASMDYSAGLFDAFKYLGGHTQPSLARQANPNGGTPVGASNFGTLRYGGTPSLAAVSARMDRGSGSLSDGGAYTDDSRNSYTPPITTLSSCARNYIVFIGNGFPSQDSLPTLLSGVNGVTTDLAQPQFNVSLVSQQETVGVDDSCHTVAQCVDQAQIVAPAGVAPDGYSGWTCSGGTAEAGTTTALGTDPGCKTPTQCASDAALVPANSIYSNFICSGGTTGGTATVNLGTDLACKTPTQCGLDAATTHGSAYTGYTCIGGNETTASTVNLALDSVCRANNPSGDTACAASAAALYGTQYDSYSCTGGDGTDCTGGTKKNRQMKGTTTACTGGSLRNQTKQGTSITCSAPNFTGQTITGTTAACLSGQSMHAFRQVKTVIPTGTSAVPPSPSKTNKADEWAKFLFTTDVNSAEGQQNAQVYTIDVFKDKQDEWQTGLLLSMAKYGGGKYFQASNETAIINALRQIMIEIQSVNTVFAAASLPINATNRSQNENQVFIGMFRPDSTAGPRWYGNLKRYQIALFGSDAKLADASTPVQEAVSDVTGFIQPCAKSFWTTGSGTYWDGFAPDSAGTCTLVAGSTFSDSPDGPQVEKGGAAEVVRKGNNPPTTDSTPTYVVGRTLKTCTGACTTLADFNSTNVTKAMVGVADDTGSSNDETLHLKIINYTRGEDVSDENQKTGEVFTPGTTDTRPSIHGDVAHSRPLPVNYGGSTGVMLYYGANDGIFRAVRGSDGKELWGFIAPEHFGALKRLHDNVPVIDYGQDPAPTAPSGPPLKKDYFFDGTAGVYQTFNADNTANTVWIFPTMRRGGRMVYGFDVSTPTTPVLKWRAGCTNPAMTDTDSCSTDMTGMGQSWSIPAVAKVRGFTNDAGVEGGKDVPLIIMGGGYDPCEDTVTSAGIATACASPKGNKVFVLNADTGAVVKVFTTGRSVAADVTLIDRSFDQRVDHAYVADTGGSIYRIDFVNPSTLAPLDETAWTMTKIAYTTGGARKFLFPPSALSAGTKTFLSIVSGDRERPLIGNYPFTEDVSNRAYMLVDSFAATGLPINLDDPDNLRNVTSDNACTTSPATGGAGAGNLGWRFNFGGSDVSSRGEQGVTSSIIFGGLVFFSTNRPLPPSASSCDNDLGEAKGYAVNLLNGSGAVGVPGLCDGARSAIFLGGGLPPSPVTGTVPVDGKPVTVMIGGINREGGASSPIGAQKVKPTISQVRSRVYWYRQGDK